jgi:hypothetical protein
LTNYKPTHLSSDDFELGVTNAWRYQNESNMDAIDEDALSDADSFEYQTGEKGSPAKTFSQNETKTNNDLLF